jgi:acetoin:2,6-dichlorophenolindophenol oxidoreductase subunit alpha
MTVDCELGLQLLQSMRRIRLFEERLSEFYDYAGYFQQDTHRAEAQQTDALLTSTLYDFASTGMIGGAVHLYIGQEAVSVGVCSCLREDDFVTGSHRGHGFFLAKGGAPRAALAELMGRRDGASHGCGGSMHLYDAAHGILGGNGIIGAQLPLALGPAFAARYRGSNAVSVAFFGEGASNQGTVYEALNLAALWQLPVIFVCENNLYAATTPAAISLPVADIAPRAEGFGVPWSIVDGQDVLAVRDVAAAAVERARSGGGPTFIEAKTYRFYGHCGALAQHANPDECAVWCERDPVALWRERLVAEGTLTAAQDEVLQAEVVAEIDEAARFAVSSPLPDPAALQPFIL